MQFHLKIISYTAIALSATALHAQGLHGEIGYSSLNLKTAAAGKRPSTRENLLRGTVGYEVHPQVAIEAMLGLGIGGGTPKINHTAGVFVKPKLLGFGEQLELFGRLGYAHTKVTTANGTTEKSGSLAYGLGASYRFNDLASVNLDYMTYRKKGGVTVGGVTAGVGIRF